jgi:hypothetical protein
MNNSINLSITPEFQQDYTEKINIGKEYVKDLSISILGLTRNNENRLKNVFTFFDDIKQYTKKTDIFIYENDSNDNTVALLEKYKQDNPNFNFLNENLGTKKFGSTKNKERTILLANCRNKCLDYLHLYQDYSDYTIVIDTDFIAFDINSILNSLGWISEYNDISAMCGISVVYYKNRKIIWNYDSWAFRQTWWEDQQLSNKSFDSMMWFGFWFPPIGSLPLPVNSGFGGCAIYKTSDLLKVRYEGYDCEHVCLHKNLFQTIDNFQLYINPSQLMLLDINNE